MGERFLAERISRLRHERGWSQTQVAKSAGIAQTVVSRLERGELTNPTRRVLSGIASAFDVPLESLLAEPWEPAAPPTIKIGEPHGVGYQRSPHLSDDTEESPLEAALFAVMDPQKYRVGDFDAARRTIHETSRYITGDADLEQLARSILDAASGLRREGKPANTASIMARVVSGPTIGTEPPRETVNVAATPVVDASLRAKGLEPGAAAGKLKERLAGAAKKS